ncbi:MAG: hypothetical protein H7177_13090 [Rhizobacter sp.]|nr:hypothetical protein [Bacteriovorax sp.]
MKKNFLGIIIFLITLTVFAEELKPNDSWFQCQKDSECINIDYNCAGNVVNTAFAKIAKDYYELENARSNCIRQEPTEAQKKIPYKVFCKSNKCGVQGINPKKPGFS